MIRFDCDFEFDVNGNRRRWSFDLAPVVFSVVICGVLLLLWKVLG